MPYRWTLRKRTCTFDISYFCTGQVRIFVANSVNYQLHLQYSASWTYFAILIEILPQRTEVLCNSAKI